MKLFFITILIFVSYAVAAQAEDDLSELRLIDGSHIKGRVMTTTASEVTVMTDFGVLRIDLAKLTAETRQSLVSNASPDTNTLLQKIAELEAKVLKLQQENEQLRRTALSSISPTYSTTSPSAPVSKFSDTSSRSAAPESTGSSYRHSVSSTGKRHNSGCRYFETGRASGPNEGIPCKICEG